MKPTVLPPEKTFFNCGKKKSLSEAIDKNLVFKMNFMHVHKKTLDLVLGSFHKDETCSM